RGRAVTVVKQVVLPARLENIRMSRHCPERIEAFGLHLAQRDVRPQPAKPCKQRFLFGIGSRRDDQTSDVPRHCRGPVHLLSPESLRHARAGFAMLPAGAVEEFAAQCAPDFGASGCLSGCARAKASIFMQRSTMRETVGNGAISQS